MQIIYCCIIAFVHGSGVLWFAGHSKVHPEVASTCESIHNLAIKFSDDIRLRDMQYSPWWNESDSTVKTSLGTIIL